MSRYVTKKAKEDEMFSGGYLRPLREVEQRERRVFARLRDWGVERAVVEFWGGNDEGGAETIGLLDNRGQLIGVVEYDQTVLYALTPKRGNVKMKTHTRTYGNERWGFSVIKSKHPVVARRIEGQEHEEVRELLEGPAESAYGGYGGAGYVHGTCTWDTRTGKYDWKESWS